MFQAGGIRQPEIFAVGKSVLVERNAQPNLYGAEDKPFVLDADAAADPNDTTNAVAAALKTAPPVLSNSTDPDEEW